MAQTARKCPRCVKGLTQVFYERVEVDICRRCTGVFLGSQELTKLVQQHDADFGLKFVEEETVYLAETYDGNCVVCKETLYYCSIDGQTDIKMTGCKSCKSFWMPEDSLELVKRHPRAKAALEQASLPFNYKHWIFQLISKMPVEFNIAPRKKPYVTIALIVLCVIAFIGSLIPDGGLMSSFAIYGFYPAEFPSLKSALNLISCIFFHVGFMHLLGNCYFLYVVGDNVEDVLGHKYFLLFFLTAGIAGGLLTFVFNGSSTSPHVGASGAVAGLMGAYVLLFRYARLTFMVGPFQLKIKSIWFFMLWFVMNVVGVLMGGKGVAWWAHIGGFLFGLAVTKSFYIKIVTANPILRLLNERMVSHDATTL